MADLRLGTSGWSYREWIGPFYPDGETKMLQHYTRIFDTAEIDSTFYSYPTTGIVHGWLRYTPRDFVFSAKLPRVITHEKKLDLEQGVDEDLSRFTALMEPLQDRGKLFAILIQLPPGLKQNLGLLEEFFRILPESYRYAIEFRDKTWWNEETWKLLREYRVANTIVDEPLLPPEPVVTADFAYIRWHGRGRRPWYNYRYSIDELKPWIPRIMEVSEKTRNICGYFNNHYHGYAVENCLQILEMLGISKPEQTQMKERVEQYIDRHVVEGKLKVSATEPQFHLEATENIPLEWLLSSFMDRSRLERASEIRDTELTIDVKKPNLIKASIRDYVIIVDLDSKTITHDCADWTKRIQEKSFCKHVGKLFLTLPEDEAKRILREIYSTKDLWRFHTVS
ncbi:MAG: DUF72 domain-containing protein [Candidatus Bathyarchaeia archaeon]|nr:DUF72 domain-containing protein [Candidatus Bathyarchaeota archaeon]